MPENRLFSFKNITGAVHGGLLLAREKLFLWRQAGRKFLENVKNSRCGNCIG
jgi:hypothetical protein